VWSGQAEAKVVGFIAGIFKVRTTKKKKNLCSTYVFLLHDTNVVTCLYQSAIETERWPKPWYITVVSGVMWCAILLLKSSSGLGTMI